VGSGLLGVAASGEEPSYREPVFYLLITEFAAGSPPLLEGSCNTRDGGIKSVDQYRGSSFLGRMELMEGTPQTGRPLHH
jgi:hypothetical protein